MPETISAPPYPWQPGSATGVGSLPGADPVEAMRLIAGELPEFPHLAELPGRGPGADLIGRTAAMLVDMPVETTASGWRLAARAGRDLSRGQALMSEDLDALEEVMADHSGPLKIQLCGPWTLAATIDLSRSLEPALSDPGAVDDLTQSLAEGIRAHVAEVRRRLPGAAVVLQIDEPALPRVLGGGVPSASGLNRLRAPDVAVVRAGLRTVLSAAGTFTVVHCCAPHAPFGILREAGAGAVSIDLDLVGSQDLEALAEAVEAGLGVLAGAVPATPSAPVSPRGTAERVTELWRRMGWPASGAAPGPAAQIVVTPACGLAGASPDGALAAMACCRDTARLLPELIEEKRS